MEAGTAAPMPVNVPHSVRTGNSGVSILVTFAEGDLNQGGEGMAGVTARRSGSAR